MLPCPCMAKTHTFVVTGPRWLSEFALGISGQQSLKDICMLTPAMTTAACAGILIALFAAQSAAETQSLPPLASGTPATPLQAQALLVFRPHVEQLCQTLYAQPDAAQSCVQRVLETAIPLDLEPTSAQAPKSSNPQTKTGSGTVGPDGRE